MGRAAARGGAAEIPRARAGAVPCHGEQGLSWLPRWRAATGNEAVQPLSTSRGSPVFINCLSMVDERSSKTEAEAVAACSVRPLPLPCVCVCVWIAQKAMPTPRRPLTRRRKRKKHKTAQRRPICVQAPAGRPTRDAREPQRHVYLRRGAGESTGVTRHDLRQGALGRAQLVYI